MDFIDGSWGKIDYIGGCGQDRFSKFAHFLPLAHSYTAVTVAHLLFDQIFCLHGLPESIVSDWDPIFISTF